MAFLRRGFSLVELLVVLLLVSLIASIVSPSMFRSIANNKVNKASRELLMAIRYTRAQAIVKQQEQRLRFDVGNKIYIIPVKNRTVHLPEKLEVKLLTAQSELFGSESASILFFGDGTSTGGKVSLIDGDREWRISVSWLTGESTLSDSRDDNENSL